MVIIGMRILYLPIRVVNVFACLLNFSYAYLYILHCNDDKPSSSSSSSNSNTSQQRRPTTNAFLNKHTKSLNILLTLLDTTPKCHI